MRRKCASGILETHSKAWLRFQIQQAIDADYVTFITGMGMGVDIWAAQIVIDLRAANPSLHLIAVEPYPGFATKWTEAWRDAYDQVVRNADLVKRVSQTYDPGAINARISWMASQEISRQQAAEIQPLMRHEHCAVFP